MTFRRLPPGVQRLGKRALRRLAAVTGIRPDGAWLDYDIRNRLPKAQFRTVFDIGANVGQTASSLLVNRPGAHIYCFEPSPATFAELQRTFVKNPAVDVFNLAFSDRPGRMRFDMRSVSSDLHRFAENSDDASLPFVEVTTVDVFCAQKSIASIDYLKSDTEGHDLNVLRGASSMIGRGAIGIVECECSMNRDNSYHTPLVALNEFLEDFGYRLFGFFEQTADFTTGKPFLRRANVAYISPAVIEENKRVLA